MDLWIRSQDRKAFIPMMELYVCKYYDKYMITNYLIECPNDEIKLPIDFISLGYFKTQERAIEVLDTIQSCIETNKMFDLYSRTGVYPNEFNKKYNLVTVYQMPID